MISTTYTVVGMRTSADARIVKDTVANVAGVGSVATEIVPDGHARIVLKHKDDVELDRAVIQAALRTAGDYALA